MSKKVAIETMLKENAVDFAMWLQHQDNGTTHYNPHTKEKTESIGFSPSDCLNENIFSINELYDKWMALNGL